jgi:hypothetical protein
VRFVVVRAAPLSRQSLRSRWHLPRGWRSLSFAVLWGVSGCTLTSDSFEPTLVDSTVAANTPAAPDLPPAAEGPGGGEETSTPSSQTDGEATPGPVALEPSGGTDGRVGGNGAGSSAVDAGADRGGKPADGEGDAGEPTPPIPECPGQALGGSCYAFFDEPASWSDAEQGCVAWGGHLASVESSQEDAFLDGLPSALGASAASTPGVWLGGTDAARDGQFVWSDGGMLVFNGFAANQPDNGVGVDCIEKRNDATSLWYDQRCTDEYSYVCERPL